MDTTIKKKAAVSHAEVARQLGLNHGYVSRLRSSNRMPSLATMQKIQQVFKWPVAKQTDAYLHDRYAADFEAVLVKKFGAADA